MEGRDGERKEDGCKIFLWLAIISNNRIIMRENVGACVVFRHITSYSLPTLIGRYLNAPHRPSAGNGFQFSLLLLDSVNFTGWTSGHWIVAQSDPRHLSSCSLAPHSHLMTSWSSGFSYFISWPESDFSEGWRCQGSRQERAWKDGARVTNQLLQEVLPLLLCFPLHWVVRQVQ